MYALGSMMPQTYMQGMMSGQAIAGIVSSATQLIVGYITISSKPKDGESNNELTSGLKIRTSISFLLSAIVVAVTIVMFLSIKKYPIYKSCTNPPSSLPNEVSLDATPVIDNEQENSTDLTQSKSEIRVIYETFLEVKHYCNALFMCFCTTLAVFPSLTAGVISVGGKLGVSLLTEWHFVMFNIGDYIGRFFAHYVEGITDFVFKFGSILAKILVSVVSRNRTSPYYPTRERIYMWFLLIFSYARWLFLPIFFAANLACKPNPIISDPSSKNFKDAWFLICILLLGITNGFIASCIMMVGPKQSKNPPVAGTICGFFLTFGLAFGSIMSFIVVSGAC
ncbi:hypothetical protein BB558_005308 [Smittium angustum]|uniref:Uncharacterized protein n=1 Tax=Smittium angustum TaxID=133377 RepID=A0A2U1J0V6_SMIAN|nr:hypothetical protein BB558_005308 [Smittium angustum]